MVSRSSESNISRMVERLKVLKSASVPTVIFLGAKAGALFRSQHLYNQLRNVGPSDLYSVSLLKRFSECHKILVENFSTDDIRNILTSGKLLKEIRPEVPELCVAQLMKQEIFNFAFSTGVHQEFEQAFEQMGMERNRDFNIFLPKKNPTTLSIAVNKKGLFTFYKLFGDIYDGCTVKDRLQYMKDYKNDLDGIASDLRAVNVLIIGLDTRWDRDIVPFLFPREGTTWYVNDEKPLENSDLHDYLEKCNAECILEFDGRYDSFIRDLCWHMTGNVPANQEILGMLEEIRNELRANKRTLLELNDKTDNLKNEVYTNQQTLQKLSEETEGLRSELGKLRGRTPKNKTEER